MLERKMVERNEQDCCMGREEYWAELPIEGKLERTREIVKRQGEEIGYLKKEIVSLAIRFGDHNHHNDNIVYRDHSSTLGTFPRGMIAGGESLGRPDNPNEVYF